MPTVSAKLPPAVVSSKAHRSSHEFGQTPYSHFIRRTKKFLSLIVKSHFRAKYVHLINFFLPRKSLNLFFTICISPLCTCSASEPVFFSAMLGIIFAEEKSHLSANELRRKQFLKLNDIPCPG